MLRKAFTTFELIVIITVIGILSVVVLPRQNNTNLQEATDQIVKHMRLAQSLALAQDFYLSEFTQSNDYPIDIPNNSIQRRKSSVQWFKRWWRIQFHQASVPSDDAYSVYSDAPTLVAFPDTTYSAQPEATDLIATDAHSGELIVRNINGIANGMRHADVDLESKYNVTLSMAQCFHVSGNINARHIVFDNQGRPHCSKGGNDNSLNPFDHLVSRQIRVTLTEKNTLETRDICVEAESGYIHICG